MHCTALEERYAVAACSCSGVAAATSAGFGLVAFLGAAFLAAAFFIDGFRTGAFFAFALVCCFAAGGFGAAACSGALRTAAHRFFCASAIRFRPAALIRRFFGAGFVVAASQLPEAPIRRRISAIVASIWLRWCSNPISAA